jgi:hypothetical protein
LGRFFFSSSSMLFMFIWYHIYFRLRTIIENSCQPEVHALEVNWLVIA